MWTHIGETGPFLKKICSTAVEPVEAVAEAVQAAEAVEEVEGKGSSRGGRWR